MDWLTRHGTPGLTAVALAPDMGQRYLETIYQTSWVAALYGEHVLTSTELAETAQAA
jgi:cysteine synthase A